MSRQRWILIVAIAVVLGLVAGGIVVLTGGSDDASAQTVTFQKPTEPGPDPFTKPSDVKGNDRVDVGSGPYGGTGSDLVCDRELLIRSLRARPDRMRAWAEVLGIPPNIQAVARYIRKLKPVTLTRDTRVTNHSFEGGRAVAFQSILQAGTAVLIDRYGEPVVRCRCGNPLTKPIFYSKATCYNCPPHYEPPPPCEPFSECYEAYPNPPPVTTSGGYRPGTQTNTGNPSASFSPSSGTVDDTYTLSVSGFSPNSRLSIRLTRPDGGFENYSLTTDGSGSGSYTFPHVNNPDPGTYTAVVSGPGGSATASASVSASSGSDTQPDQTDTNDQTHDARPGHQHGARQRPGRPAAGDRLRLLTRPASQWST